MSEKSGPRITIQVLKTLAMFLEEDPHPLSGADIFNRTKMFSGTLYPILLRLEGAGWIKGHWEDLDPTEAGRPRKRLYKLTGLGRTRARAELRDLQSTATIRLPGSVVGDGQ